MGFCDSFNCGYWRQEEGEDFPRCHFDGPDGWAPCEHENEEDEDE